MGSAFRQKASTGGVYIPVFNISWHTKPTQSLGRGIMPFRCTWALGADPDGDTRRPGVTVFQVEGSDAALASGQVPCRHRL